MAKVFLFHAECPKGEMFDDHQVEALSEQGWVDSPAKLDLPEENKTPKLTQDQIDRARPDDLVGLVKSMGFKVMTDLELTAEINKAAAGASPAGIETFSDEELIAEAERRGLKQSAEDAEALNELQDRFNEDPESLNKDELVALGNNGFKLGLRSNMKEATLIEKINAAMNEAA